MKGTALTAFLPNLTGFTSPGGSTVHVFNNMCPARRDACAKERAPGGNQTAGRLHPRGASCPVSAGTASPATAAGGRRSAAGRGRSTRTRTRRGVAPAGPPAAARAAAGAATGAGAGAGRTDRHGHDERNEEKPDHNEDEHEARPLSHAPVFPGDGIPASRVKGGCPQATRPKAHLSKSRGCPQDGAHERTREQRPPLPQPPSGGLRHHDLRGDVGAGRPHRVDQPGPGLPRHRRPRRNRRGGLPRGPHGPRQPVPAGPRRPRAARRDRRAPAALLRPLLRPGHRGPGHGRRHRGHRGRAPRPPRTG